MWRGPLDKAGIAFFSRRPSPTQPNTLQHGTTQRTHTCLNNRGEKRTYVPRDQKGESMQKLAAVSICRVAHDVGLLAAATHRAEKWFTFRRLLRCWEGWGEKGV